MVFDDADQAGEACWLVHTRPPAPVHLPGHEQMGREYVAQLQGDLSRFTQLFGILTGMPGDASEQAIVQRASALLDAVEQQQPIDALIGTESAAIAAAAGEGNPSFPNYLTAFARHVVKLQALASEADPSAERRTPAGAAFAALLNYADQLQGFIAPTRLAAQQAGRGY